MNRSVLAVLFVGFLVLQGSVTGFVSTSSVSDIAENNTTGDEMVSTQLSERGNNTSTNTQSSSSTVTAATNGVTQLNTSQSSPISTNSAPQATGLPATAIAETPSRATSAGTQRSAPAGASSSQSARTISGAQGGSTGASTASPDAEFSVVSVSSDVLVGGTGNVSVTIENTGEDATNAVVTLTSLSGDLRFGRSQTTSRFVGEWNEGETKTIEIRARALRTADTTEYPVRATISYEDDNGTAAQSAPLTFGVTPDDEQQFSLSGVEGDLHVGESGTISGTITNEGPETAADAVLRFAPNGSRAVVPRQSGYVLGSLDPGESASFELPVFVNRSVEPGERQIPLVVQYYDSNGNPMRSERLTTHVDIAPERETFEIVDVTSTVESGEQGILSVTIENTGENITDTTVSFQSLSAGILFGQSPNATQFVEEWNAGERRTFDFEVTAAESATGQTYPMQVSLTYENIDGDRARSEPLQFGVSPDEQQDDFSVLSSSTDVQVGGTGTVSVTLENTGEDASAAVVTVQSLSGDITFGRSANATQFVGAWPAGAQRTVTFNATASNRTDIRSYPFQVSVSYEDTDSDQRQAGPFTVGVMPLPEQAFDITNSSSTLRVGSEGTITATIANRGPQNVSNAVVRLVTQSQNINPQETEAAIGTLPAGESATISFPVAITDSAEAGQRQFSFIVEYDNQNGDTRRSGTLDAQVSVGPQREAFVVERANSSVDAGASGTVTLNVTNNRETAVSNINAKAYVDDPLSISNSEAYIARLAPNETAQIAFDVSASDSATAGQYPLSVDFEYETASGESKLSQTYEVAVSVTAAEGGGIFSSLGLTIGLGVLLVVLGIGWVWSRR